MYVDPAVQKLVDPVTLPRVGLAAQGDGNVLAAGYNATKTRVAASVVIAWNRQVRSAQAQLPVRRHCDPPVLWETPAVLERGGVVDDVVVMLQLRRPGRVGDAVPVAGPAPQHMGNPEVGVCAGHPGELTWGELVAQVSGNVLELKAFASLWRCQDRRGPLGGEVGRCGRRRGPRGRLRLWSVWCGHWSGRHSTRTRLLRRKRGCGPRGRRFGGSSGARRGIAWRRSGRQHLRIGLG